MTNLLVINAWTAFVGFYGDNSMCQQPKACNLVQQVRLGVHWSLRVAPSDVIDAPLCVVLLSLSLDVVIQCGDELQQQSKHCWKAF